MDMQISDLLADATLVSTPDGNILIGLGQPTLQAEPDLDRVSFYFPDFFLSSEQWITHPVSLELSPAKLLDRLNAWTPLNGWSPRNACPPQHPAPSEPGVAAGAHTELTWQPAEPTLFFKQFAELQRYFAEGKLLKAVPFMMERSESSMTPFQLVKSLKAALIYLKKYPGHLYGHWNAREGILGVTPELLFRAERGARLELSTLACAGTTSQAADATEVQRFLNDPKERHEHQIVIDGICQALAPYGSVTVSDLQVLRLGRLNHLLTPIQASLHSSLSFPIILRALHPTPALGAFPKAAGEQWLRDYSTVFDRRRYGAPVGYVRPGGRQALFLVAIRNVQWDEQAAYVAAGCGVVERSQPEREWAEIQLKMRAIKEMLDL